MMGRPTPLCVSRLRAWAALCSSLLGKSCYHCQPRCVPGRRKLAHLIRHGESTFNAAYRETGEDPIEFDAPLSPLGRRQVAERRAAFEALAVELVVTSPFTFFASAGSAAWLGARPQLCDVNPETALIEPETARGAIDGTTRCLLPVHLYGQLVDLRGFRALADERFTFRFFLVDDPSPNAFALPGGYVYVTRGLLPLLQTEDELAGVMAHEIIHVAERHGVRRARRGLLGGLLEAPGASSAAWSVLRSWASACLPSTGARSAKSWPAGSSRHCWGGSSLICS